MPIEIAATSPYLYVAAICFYGSSLTSDLLLIRLCLTVAYFFLILTALSGYGPSGSFEDPPIASGVIDIPMFLNAGLFVIHLAVCYRLITDEMHRRGETELESALFHFFKARCSMTPVEFAEVYKNGKWLVLGAGEEVEHCRNRLCLVVDGVVKCRAFFNGKWTSAFIKRSGQFFDLRMFNVFTLPIGYDNKAFIAKTETAARLFYWDFDGLQAMANSTSPSLVQFWEFMVLRALTGESVKHHLSKTETLYDSLLVPEDSSWLHGGRSRDYTARNIDQNLPCFPVSLARWVWASISVFPPRGVRHHPGILEPNSKKDAIEASVKRAAGGGSVADRDQLLQEPALDRLGGIADKSNHTPPAEKAPAAEPFELEIPL